MTYREEIIGNARRELGESGAALNPHVAGLAKAEQVPDHVGFRGGCEKAEGSDVVNRYGAPNDLSAFLAGAVVAFDRSQPRLNPALPAVCRDATDVIARGWSGLVSGLPRTMAGLAAESIPALRSVLASNPRLDLEACTAVPAAMGFADDGIDLARPLGGEGVGWAESGSKLVADQVRAAHHPVLHVPLSAACVRTEARFRRSVGLDGEGRRADLASLRNHATGVAGTTGIAKLFEAQRQGNLFGAAA